MSGFTKWRIRARKSGESPIKGMEEPTCPHRVRPDLPPLTARIAKLPVDERGYPVPYFVAWINNKPDFRMSDANKLFGCVRGSLCWVCGQALGTHKTFPIGPMCSINRISSEPPSHLDCAEWSVKGCPFLSKPKMVRREDELVAYAKQFTPGVSIERNPGVTLLWTTKSYTLISDGKGGKLFSIGDVVSASWWREGRAATRAEVMEGFDAGYPELLKVCQGPEDAIELGKAREAALQLVPK